MYKKQKPVRVHATMDAEVVKQMKDCLNKVNKDKSISYVSQSEFISEAVKQLLKKELNNG